MAFAPNMAACPFQQIFSICYCYVFTWPLCLSGCQWVCHEPFLIFFCAKLSVMEMKIIVFLHYKHGKINYVERKSISAR